MEMLDPLHRLQRIPILEPDDLCQALASQTRLDQREAYVVPRHPAAKRPVDKVVDFLSHGSRQLACGRVVFELKFGPDDQMDDFRVNPIRPIIVQDFQVDCKAIMSNVTAAWLGGYVVFHQCRDCQMDQPPLAHDPSIATVSRL